MTFQSKEIRVKKMKYEEQIKNLILTSEDYPTMQNVIDHVQHILKLEGDEAADFFIEMLKMNGEGRILYDPKHDSWLWTEPSEKLKRMLSRCKPL